MVINVKTLRSILLVALLAVAAPAFATPFAEPGDVRLRHDLQLLSDARLINRPLTTWPLSWPDVLESLDAIDAEQLSGTQFDAYMRVRRRVDAVLATGLPLLRATASAASRPRVIRTFENTPRENGEVSAGVEWTGNRFAANLNATYATNAGDGDTTRPDGTFLGVAFGNWMISAGWQERWWGPGYGGSLILSSNARPMPAIALQRRLSDAFESPWLSWIGPWSLSTFMGILDDERVVEDALTFGLRAAFRPHPSLEIGISRTAQWCGADRPCGGSEFLDLLLGHDNQGVNVDVDEEPGNQLGGVDLRWSLPRNLPVAVYAQWIGEDTRRGGPEIGSWLRLAGVEHWGSVAGLQYRAYAEAADTSCRDGGVGFADIAPNCAYEHSIYRTGYRYKGRSLGHGMDGDGLSYSIGSTLVQSGGDTWTVIARHMKLNRVGAPQSRHTLTATPQDLTDVQINYTRALAFGSIQVGVGYSRLRDGIDDRTTSDASGFLRWSSQ